jgi:hypothetical protein
MGPPFFSSHRYSLSSFSFSYPIKTLKRFLVFLLAVFSVRLYLLPFLTASSVASLIE